MNKYLNKLLSAVLAVMMCISVIPVSIASAANADIVIKTADEFRNFADKVNAGDNFSGKTVLLDADISLVGSDSQKIQ